MYFATVARLTDFNAKLQEFERGLALCCLRSTRLAAEIVRRVDTSGALVRRNLRIGTERPRPNHPGLGRMRRDDPVGRVAGLHPSLECSDDIKGVRSFAAPAVVHA